MEEKGRKEKGEEKGVAREEKMGWEWEGRKEGERMKGHRGRGLGRKRIWSWDAASITVISYFSEGVGSLHYSVYYTNSLYCKLYAMLYIPDTVLCNIFYSVYYTSVLYTILVTILILYTLCSVLFSILY